MSASQIIEQPDLRRLIAHRECVQASDTLEAVHKRFAAHEYEFMLVMEGEKFAGLCERQKVGMVLGARYGFAMYSRKPVGETMLPETTIIKINQPLSEVLAVTCSRPDKSLYDDVVLMDESGAVLGLVFSRTLVRLQNGLLQENVKELNAKNNQMQGDLQLAREIQFAMLPGKLPEVSGGNISLRLCQRYQPSGVVSGDFFHVLKISDHAVGVFICDVVGHGVRSAFVTATLRALVEEMRPLGDSPGDLLTRVNGELMQILKPMDNPLYATAYYLVGDAMNGQIRFARAGHPNPLLLQRKTGEVRALNCPADVKGPALGMMENAKYGSGEDRVEADDLILLFTDGITEVFDTHEQEFGAAGLMTGMKARSGLTADALVDGLLTDARNHSADNNFDDDVCVVAVEAARV